MKPGSYGIAASFTSMSAFRTACTRVREAGFTQWETYSPHIVADEEGGATPRRRGIPAIMIAAGGLGALGGFLLQAYATHDFPSNSGGRPVFSWPAFIPITFELGVLTAVLTGIAVFLWRAGFPNYAHPGFTNRVLKRAALDRYVICIRLEDPLLEQVRGRRALAGLGAEQLEEVAR